jgi:AraC-like DNA-binding protein
MIAEGAVLLRNNFGLWCVPTGKCVWIPAGSRHSIEGKGRARARTLYIWRAPAGPSFGRCAALNVSPLLRALVDHICRMERLRAHSAASKRLAAVLLDQIAAQRELPLHLPPLRSSLTQRADAMMRRDPADTPRIRELAAVLGVSDRTLERAFLDDVAMSVGEYRRRWRLVHAIALLADGLDVRDVALEVGYATPSAFVAAFRKSVGATPGNTRARMPRRNLS